jgi:acetyltransferase-like isoleucine patch superfamily enzyme
MRRSKWALLGTILASVAGVAYLLTRRSTEQPMLMNERDRIASSEVATELGMTKLQLGLWFAKNWVLERLASVLPVPSWRVACHRMRGIPIGENVYIGYDVIFDRIYPHCIHVEDGVEIGDRSIISAHSRGSLMLRDVYERKIEPVHIRRGAWIMPGVIVAPGITIGERAVIGTGAVVTKDIPPQALAVGVPAKVVRIMDLPAAEEGVGG